MHRVSASDEELAVAAWLRENPKIAKKYGINDCNGKTRVGSMLLQVLAFMGGTAEWRERPPQQAEHPPKGSNASLSAMLASVKRRAGRVAQPNPQPPMNAPREAAIKQSACGAARKRGRSPKPEFPALKRAVLRDRVRRMVASWRRKRFTSRGNERLAPQEVALAQARARERVSQIVRHTLTARHAPRACSAIR